MPALSELYAYGMAKRGELSREAGFFDFLQFLLKCLIKKAGLLSPRLTLGIRLSGVGYNFPAVYILVTLRLTR